MARTYSNTPVLSKLKIENTVYWLKDADARALLDSIDSGIWAQLLAGFGTIGTSGDENKFVKASDIKSYVDQIAEAALEIVALSSLPAANESSWSTYHNSIVLIPKSSAQTDNAKDEYVIVRAGTSGSYTYSWEKIGDTEIDLSGYLTGVSYVANSHKLQQTKGGATTDVHTFGDMADADQGEVNLSAYLKGVSAKVTAAGAIAKDNTNGVQISGAVSAITVIDSVGSAPSLTTATKALYKQGMKASVGTGADAETLIIENVDKEADIDVVSSWSAGSVPTTKSVTPTFTGDKFKFVGSEVNATVTPTTGGTETVNPKASA